MGTTSFLRRLLGGGQGGVDRRVHELLSLCESLLAESGVPAFRTPESCADALAAYFSWRSPRPGATGSVEWPRELPKRGPLD